MHTELKEELRRIVRNHFGSCEMRFYEDSVTVTLIRDFDKYTSAESGNPLLVEVEGLLDDNGLLNSLSVEVVSSNRFKLRVNNYFPGMDAVRSNNEIRQQVAKDRFADAAEQARASGLDLKDLRQMIGDVVSEAHEASQLEDLLKKEIERDVEDFICTNLGAAMVLLKKSCRTITLEEVKELMRFSYLSGLWKNARERDLQVLADVYNKHFEKYANEMSLEGDAGQA